MNTLQGMVVQRLISHEQQVLNVGGETLTDTHRDDKAAWYDCPAPHTA